LGSKKRKRQTSNRFGWGLLDRGKLGVLWNRRGKGGVMGLKGPEGLRSSFVKVKRRWLEDGEGGRPVYFPTWGEMGGATLLQTLCGETKLRAPGSLKVVASMRMGNPARKGHWTII